MTFEKLGWAVVAVLLAGPAAPADDQADRLLQAAIHKEMVDGDLKSAVEQYKKLSQSTNRAVAATALVHLGQCYEKLGDREARKAYERVVRDYADQDKEASEARARLMALAGGARTTQMLTRRVWSGTDWANLGPPSPDSRLFPCTDWENGGDVAVCDLATGKKRRLTNKSPESPGGIHDVSFFSPDGRQVAYVWWSKGSPELRVVGLDGSKPRVVYSSDAKLIVPCGWSPDGKYILTMHTAKQDHTNRLVWIAVADGSLREVKAFDTRYPFSTRLSPDGRFIAYDLAVEKGSANHEIYVISSDGGREVQLSQHGANNYPLAWTPDGGGILFASDRSGNWDAWVVKVAEGRPQGPPEIVKKDIGRVSPLGFARNGSFYYSLDTSKSDLYVAALDLATGKILTPPSPVSQRFVGSNTEAVWSPDGQYLAYFSVRGPAWAGAATIALRIRSLQNGQERELLPNMHNLQEPRWLPDGRSISVSGYDLDDHSGLYRIDVQTGDVSPIIRVEDGTWPSLGGATPDGRTIFYCLEDETSGIIRSRDLNTGQENELYRATSAMLWNVALSPDGQKVAFTLSKSKESPSLNVIPSKGGQPRQLLRLKQPEGIPYNGVAWTPDGRELVFVKGSGVDFKSELWSVPADGGEPRKLDLAGDGMNCLRFHPDGSRITFASSTWSSEIWVLENFLPARPGAK